MKQLDEANLAINGGLVINGRANPAVQIKVSLSNVIVNLNRLLGLSASQKGSSVATKSKQDNKSDISGQFDDLKLFSFDD
jgi:phage terminase small subunit